VFFPNANRQANPCFYLAGVVFSTEISPKGMCAVVERKV